MAVVGDPIEAFALFVEAMAVTFAVAGAPRRALERELRKESFARSAGEEATKPMVARLPKEELPELDADQAPFRSLAVFSPPTGVKTGT